MLLGELDLNGAPAVKALQSLSSQIEHMEHKLKGFAESFGGFFVVWETVERVFEGFEGVLGMGAHLQALSLATGQSVHDLEIFGHALDITGGSADQALTFIFKLQNAIAGVNEDGQSTAESLKLLGTSAKELRDLPLLEQVERLQKGLAGIGDQSARVAAIKNLFGFRFAAQALPLLANPEALETAKKQAEPLAAVLDRNAHSFHELEVAIKGAGLGFKEFFAGALEVFAPKATEIGEAIGSIDFVGMGRAVGQILNVFLELGKILIWLEPLISGISKAMEKLNAGFGYGAAIGGTYGAFAGPLGALIGAGAGGVLGQLLAPSDAKPAHHGFAEAFKGLAQGDLGGGDNKSLVTSLQRVGGGGGFGGGADPLLTEARLQTRTLAVIAENTRPGRAEHAAPPEVLSH